MDGAPAKSIFGDRLRRRDNELFRLYYFELISHFHSLLSVSRKKKEVSFEQFYAFDSTTITLFSDVMKGVGRHPKGDGKKRGGLKVHMLTDVHADNRHLHTDNRHLYCIRLSFEFSYPALRFACTGLSKGNPCRGCAQPCIDVKR
ncbi:MAG: hypothetical protein LBR08_08855, partial [Bacteroidales bacterium]|nr:hypothetical protein [Bacteroidales bacterium]